MAEPIVKICGITNVQDALDAVRAGADAVGLMFYSKSSRFITAETARRIVDSIPKEIRKVGVFVDTPAETIRETIKKTGIDTVQLHGNEDPIFCESLTEIPVFKAIRVNGPESLKNIASFAVEAILLDSFVLGSPGGTGSVFNWELAVKASRQGRKIILAGGLTPENIEEAVKKVHPYGVDVSSGVEQSPGKKDYAKMAAFVKHAKTQCSADPESEFTKSKIT